jgi:hypothetical protein
MEELSNLVEKLELLHKLFARTERIRECKLRESIRKRIQDELDIAITDVVAPLGGSPITIRMSQAEGFKSCYLVTCNGQTVLIRARDSKLEHSDYHQSLTARTQNELVWKSCDPIPSLRNG